MQEVQILKTVLVEPINSGGFLSQQNIKAHGIVLTKTSEAGKVVMQVNIRFPCARIFVKACDTFSSGCLENILYQNVF